MWLLTVTMTAGVQMIISSDVRIGFLAQAKVLNQKLPELSTALETAKGTREVAALESAKEALRVNRILHFNTVLDATVAAVFLGLVAAIFLISVREWILLLARRKLAVLRESQPVWLPSKALAEGQTLRIAGLLGLGFVLVKELSGEAQMERAQRASLCTIPGSRVEHKGCAYGSSGKTDAQIYLELSERRFNGVTRCC
jgi:hypothetical protein